MPRRIALIPAAGVGSRAATSVPKQYVPLNGVPLLVHTLQPFLDCAAIDLVLVVLAPHDPWDAGPEATAMLTEAAGRLAFARVGGETRAASVVNGLQHLGPSLAADDWVLVHDAARPCITESAIGRLIESLSLDAVGGLLAIPVADTVKRADPAGRVSATVARDGLWLAQTPQMFRAGLLARAYAAHPGATDEAGAVEALGLAPRLVAGDADNLKVTFPDDIVRAERILNLRRSAGR